jgi:lysophospholipase L1-like esterase
VPAAAAFAAAAWIVVMAGISVAQAKPMVASPALLPHVAHRISLHEPLRIVAFGSSSTKGVGATKAIASYPSRLQVILRTALHTPVEVLNMGVGGNDAADMDKRIPQVVAARPDLVIWQTGSNDPLKRLPLSRFEALTRRGIAIFRAADADVMLMEPQDCTVLRETPGAWAYRDSMRAIGQELRVPVVRRYDLMHTWLAEGVLTHAQLMSGDGLHMTDGGYERLAEEVSREILAFGGASPGRIASTMPGAQPHK